MGTKADFYIKRGEELEWRGSIEWEGNEDKIPNNILQARSELEFQESLDFFFKTRKDIITPDMPWPWHWDSSKFTDFTYIMWEEKGKVVISHFNSQTYTIYQYREYMKKMRESKTQSCFDSFEGFLKKVGDFRPEFPNMRNKHLNLKSDSTEE